MWCFDGRNLGVNSMNSRYRIAGQLTRFFRNEKGASSVEYALIAGFIAVVIVVSLVALGSGLSGLYGRIKDNVACVATLSC